MEMLISRDTRVFTIETQTMKVPVHSFCADFNLEEA